MWSVTRSGEVGTLRIIRGLLIIVILEVHASKFQITVDPLPSRRGLYFRPGVPARTDCAL